MAESIRIHLDENINPAVARGLRRRGVDVTTSQETGLLGQPDAEQLNFARRESRVIYTEDADFLIYAAQTNQHSGIAFSQKGSRTIGEVIASLELIVGVMKPEEMQGHVEYL